jgi:ABC-2 type transport system permease protein
MSSSIARTFLALLGRDVWVTVRHDNIAFLAQALLQPIFFLFIFGRVLPDIGAAQGGYGAALLPGVLALTLFLTSLQATALPLVLEFSFTKEIEDRLLAPAPVWAVAVEKLVFAAGRGIVPALLILPLGALILPGGIDLAGASWPGFAAILLAGSLAGGSVGLLLGTVVPPNRINIAFTVILTPLLFTGATFYPWTALGNLRWFQVVTLFNPLTYVSEGSRGALTGVSHLGNGWVALGLAGSLVAFGTAGLLGFNRRAVD